MGGTITDCGRTLTPPANGTCTYTAGNTALLLEGTVLTEAGSLRGGQVVVKDGRITCAACDCSGDANYAGATKISCAHGVISPALINAHDHVTFDQLAPYAPSGSLADERYEHRHDWRKGQNGHTRIASPSGGDAATRIAELRQLLAGTASINGSGGVAGLLRNLDKASLREGLTGAAVAYQTFPLGDSDGTTRTSGCTYGTMDRPTDADIAGASAYTPHVSEGINVAARNEFLCQSGQGSGSVDLVMAKSAFIHGVGLKPEDFAIMGSDGTALIWSPRSNVSLYGHTANVTLAHTLGVEIAVGTDWTLSGSVSMLRELACVDQLNNENYGGFFTDAQIWAMGTLNAASVLGAEGQLGSLRAGKVADIAIFAGDDPAGNGARKDWRAVITAEPKHVTLLLRGGKVMSGDDAIVGELPDGGSTGCETITMCGTQKRVCAKRETGSTIAQIKSAAPNYDVFFCGTPPNEPTCTPIRPAGNVYAFTPASSNDQDGDGVPDNLDNCPTVFNPTRPLDGNAQPNADGDDDGDVCDPCPFNANSLTCSAPDPNDQDGDTIPNATDNCPTVANPEQEDRDHDDKGDVCDACPDTANPGENACPATVYAIKQGEVTGVVSVSNLLVTAVGPTGFFAQTVAGDESYNATLGVDYSAVFTYLGTATKPSVGDRVDIRSAEAADYFGQKQLSRASFVVTSTDNPRPAPLVIADPASVATGGARAAALEAVLVEVRNVEVLDLAPAPGAADAADPKEFVVTGNLRVNDYLYLVPRPTLGETLARVAGVLRFANNNSKIEPRDENDVGRALQLLSITPAQGFVRVGEERNVFEVTLNMVTDVPVQVALLADGPEATVPETVEVPAGSSRAMVPVTGVTEALEVTVTATYVTSQSASVRVLAADAMPKLVSFTASATTARPGDTVTLTATLDIPAAAGGASVTLAQTGAPGGTLPASIDILADALSRTGTFVPAEGEGDVEITATYGADSLVVTVTVANAQAGTGLVINEVDYDNVGTDTKEYVELFNAGSGSVDLTGLALIPVNGSNGAVYNRVDLSGSLAAGAYLVVANNAVTGIDPAATVIRFTTTQDSIQNGAPDGLLLWDSVNKVVVDALAYEGTSNLTNLTIDGTSGVTLVEGTALPTNVADSNTVEGALARIPNGTDSNNASLDWRFTTTLTPGRVNE